MNILIAIILIQLAMAVTGKAEAQQMPPISPWGCFPPGDLEARLSDAESATKVHEWRMMRGNVIRVYENPVTGRIALSLEDERYGAECVYSKGLLDDAPVAPTIPNLVPAGIGPLIGV